MQEESGKLRRPSNTNHNNRFDSIRYNVAAEDYPLKFVSLYTPDNEDDRADTLPPTSSIAASPSIGIFSKARRSLADIFVDFCDRTSSHGVPHIASSPSLLGKIIWTIVFVACSVVFAYQTYLTVHDYMRWRTIIEIELKFEAVAFPAVTVCNLNPYKRNLLFNITDVVHVYQQYLETIRPSTATHSMANRTKRQVDYHPIYAHCRCTYHQRDCVPLYNMEEADRTTCLCFEERKSGDIWPCYHLDMWTDEKRCTNCSLTNSCELPESDEASSENFSVPCICQTVSHKCIKLPPEGIPWWRPLDYNRYNLTTSTTTESSPPTPSIDMTGSPFASEENAGSAITRLTTHIWAIVSAMDYETRLGLSYDVNELVVWCTFNAEACNLTKDFRVQFDPVYGNCYTFNYNEAQPFRNIRAGPAYGLRMLLNVHQSDYLPFTEAAGVRIHIHDQNHFPFPDSLGYSAPTGMISSFGLKCQKMTRIRGRGCQGGVLPNYYVFNESYSTEGCIRSCFQRLAIEECGCGDPKFPVREGQRTCYAVANETTCLIKFSEKFGKMALHHPNGSLPRHQCTCEQPCTDTVYLSTYSAATWPADNFIISKLCPEDVVGKDCVAYARTNTALVEIFFEQMSYEDLTEREAYGLINLLADFGGNIGLWIGFSVITFVEFVELFLELMVFCYNRTRARASRKKKLRYTRPVAFQYVNRVAEESFHGPSPSVEESEGTSIAARTSKT